MKRKLLFFGLLLLLLMGISGCKADKSSGGEQDLTWNRSDFRREVELYKQGFYYMKDSFWLSYFDTESQTAVVVCNRNGCKHNTDKCFAYIKGAKVPYIWENHLYFLTLESEIIRCNLDNTGKEVLMQIGEAERKDGKASIWVKEYIVSGHRMYAVVRKDPYQAGEQEVSIRVIDLKTREESELLSVNAEEKDITLDSAKGNLLYYEIRDRNMKEDYTQMTEEAQEAYLKEAEKTTHIELYCADIDTGKTVLVKEVKNGAILEADGENGVFYGEFLGTGYWDFRNIIYKNPETGEEQKLVEYDEGYGINGAIVFLEKCMYISAGGEYFFYDVKDRLPVEPLPDWVMGEKGASLISVPNGYAYEKVDNDEGTTDWYYLPEEEVQKENGTAILAE